MDEMDRSQSTSRINLPVFAFPQELVFYIDDRDSHIQRLTLYNPTDFLMQYIVMGTAPRRYALSAPEGVIKPRFCQTITVQHLAVSPANAGVMDKFRIKLQEPEGRGHLIGKKDITATVLKTRIPEIEPVEPEQLFHQLRTPLRTQRSELPQSQAMNYDAVNVQRRETQSRSPFLIFICVVIFCCTLMLPTEGAVDSQVPAYLHLSVHQKMMLSFALGMFMTLWLTKT